MPENVVPIVPAATRSGGAITPESYANEPIRFAPSAARMFATYIVDKSKAVTTPIR